MAVFLGRKRCDNGVVCVVVIRHSVCFVHVIHSTFKRIICVAVGDFYIGAGFCQRHGIFGVFTFYFDVRHGLRCARTSRLVLNVGLLVSVLPNGNAVFIADGVACTDNRCLLLRQRVRGNRQRIAVTGNIKACFLKIK